MRGAAVCAKYHRGNEKVQKRSPMQTPHGNVCPLISPDLIRSLREVREKQNVEFTEFSAILIDDRVANWGYFFVVFLVKRAKSQSSTVRPGRWSDFLASTVFANNSWCNCDREKYVKGGSFHCFLVSEACRSNFRTRPDPKFVILQAAAAATVIYILESYVLEPAIHTLKPESAAKPPRRRQPEAASSSRASLSHTHDSRRLHESRNECQSRRNSPFRSCRSPAKHRHWLHWLQGRQNLWGMEARASSDFELRSGGTQWSMPPRNFFEEIKQKTTQLIHYFFPLAFVFRSQRIVVLILIVKCAACHMFSITDNLNCTLQSSQATVSGSMESVQTSIKELTKLRSEQ